MGLPFNMYTMAGWINVIMGICNFIMFLPWNFKECKIAAREAMRDQGKTSGEFNTVGQIFSWWKKKNKQIIFPCNNHYSNIINSNFLTRFMSAKSGWARVVFTMPLTFDPSSESPEIFLREKCFFFFNLFIKILLATSEENCWRRTSGLRAHDDILFSQQKFDRSSHLLGRFKRTSSLRKCYCWLNELLLSD